MITKAKSCSSHQLEATDWKVHLSTEITTTQTTGARARRARQGTRRCSGGGAPHLARLGQAVLLLPQLPAGHIQALLTQPVALQLLFHLLLRLGLPLLKLPNACQELLVAVHLALPREEEPVRARWSTDTPATLPQAGTKAQTRPAQEPGVRSTAHTVLAPGPAGGHSESLPRGVICQLDHLQGGDGQ